MVEPLSNRRRSDMNRRHFLKSLGLAALSLGLPLPKPKPSIREFLYLDGKKYQLSGTDSWTYVYSFEPKIFLAC